MLKISEETEKKCKIVDLFCYKSNGSIFESAFVMLFSFFLKECPCCCVERATKIFGSAGAVHR